MLQHLHVVLRLTWLSGDRYRAEVDTTVTDSCYKEVSIRHGLPNGMKGMPEMAYITAELSHDGEACATVMRTIKQTIDGVHSSGHPLGVTAFVTIGDNIVGFDREEFPRAEAEAMRAGTGACTKCTCKGFVEDPNDPDICIGNRPPQGKCQHKKSDHK
jgi:hypothetical protein